MRGGQGWEIGRAKNLGLFFFVEREREKKTYSHTGIRLGYVDDGGVKLFLLVVGIADNDARECDADENDSRGSHRSPLRFFPEAASSLISSTIAFPPQQLQLNGEFTLFDKQQAKWR